MARREWTCGACQTVNTGAARLCEFCGQEAATAEMRGELAHCAVHGESLDAMGFCREGNGYPTVKRVGKDVVRQKCPFACPICRGPLTWEGACFRCRGSRTSQDRATWTFPGDRYEDQDGQHYRPVSGPAPQCSDAEMAAGFADLRRILAPKFEADVFHVDRRGHGG